MTNPDKTPAATPLMDSLRECDERAKGLPTWATDINAAHAAQYDRPAAPTGEEVETPTLDELRADVSEHFIQLAAWARDQHMYNYAGDVEADAALVDARLTAQATELAALRARVKAAEPVLRQLVDFAEDRGVERLPAEGYPLPHITHGSLLVLQDLRAALAPRQTDT